jgi:hypothetical protein
MLLNKRIVLNYGGIRMDKTEKDKWIKQALKYLESNKIDYEGETIIRNLICIITRYGQIQSSFDKAVEQNDDTLRKLED